MKQGLLSIAMGLAMLTVTGTAEAADLVLEKYFTGRTKAEGKFSAINGVSRTFAVKLSGGWDGHILTLREDFHFADGERDTKTWRFRKTGEGRYSGTREDVIGATDVVIDGNTARFNYLVNLGTLSKPNTVRFYDKMELQPDGTLVNTALVTKYLFPVAITKVVFSR